MKWSYTNGKLNVSSDETDQQFLLKELIEEELEANKEDDSYSFCQSLKHYFSGY